MNIIETKNLTKEFKRYKKQEGLLGSLKGLVKREYVKKVAIDKFNLEIKEGEFVGLIGPNGAGKTTLVKLLTGIIAPTDGDVNVLGFIPNKLENEMKQQYAIVMGQKSQLFFELTTSDTLKLFKEMYGISDDKYKVNRAYFVELFDVSELMDVQVRTLSLGERMKMELIAALLHNPKVLFLDEPTIGLDVIASRQIRNFLKEVNEKKGTTIILTSHYMEDIKMLCKRSIVVNHGRKIYDGESDVLFERYQRYKKISFTVPDCLSIELPDWCKVIEQKEGKIVVELPKEMAAALLEDIINKYMPKDITVEEEEIGKVVERIYQEEGVKNE